MKNTTYIAHHGVKGQKWGIRRFQNPDGTLTDQGRRHYKYAGFDEPTKKEAKRSAAFDKASLKYQNRLDKRAQKADDRAFNKLDRKQTALSKEAFKLSKVHEKGFANEKQEQRYWKKAAKFSDKADKAQMEYDIEKKYNETIRLMEDTRLNSITLREYSKYRSTINRTLAATALTGAGMIWTRPIVGRNPLNTKATRQMKKAVRQQAENKVTKANKQTDEELLNAIDAYEFEEDREQRRWRRDIDRKGK